MLRQDLVKKRTVVLIDVLDDLTGRTPDWFDSRWTKQVIWLERETFSGARDIAGELEAVLAASDRSEKHNSHSHRRSRRPRNGPARR